MTIEPKQNWDGTWSLYLDGEEVFARKSQEEVEEKKTFLETKLKVQELTPVDIQPPVE